MIFTALNTPEGSDAVYVSGAYRIVLSKLGFGFTRSHLYCAGEHLDTFEGREALDLASVAAAQHCEVGVKSETGGIAK